MQLAAEYAAHASRNKHINIDTHTEAGTHTGAGTHRGRHTQSQIRHANVNGEVGGQANSTEECKPEKRRESERVKKKRVCREAENEERGRKRERSGC